MKETLMASIVMAHNYGNIFDASICQNVGCFSSSESSEASEGKTQENMAVERNNERPDERREASVGRRREGGDLEAAEEE